MDMIKKMGILQKVNEQALVQFFETMCPMPVTIGEAMPPAKGEVNFQPFDLVGIVALSGDCVGSVSVHVQKKLAQKVAGTMLGMEVESDGEINDMVGEMSNMVAGGGKSLANSYDLNFNISCPTVVAGNGGVKALSSHETVTSYQNFSVDGMPMLVTTIIKEK